MQKPSGYSVRVSFIPKQDITAIPAVKAGQWDSVWVRTKTRSKKAAEEAARRKIRECYGVEIEQVEVSQSSWMRS